MSAQMVITHAQIQRWTRVRGWAHTPGRVVTHDPSWYGVSDGQTPCGYRSYRSLYGSASQANRCASVGTPEVAVHVLRRDLPIAPAGTHLCAYHSPWDVRTAPVASAGVPLGKLGDVVASARPVGPESAEVRLTSGGGEGGWVTYEPRGVVEGWRRECLRSGGYVMAAIWGQVLRGEV